MEKTKRYPGTKFDAIAFAAAEKAFRLISAEKVKYQTLVIDFENEKWSFDSLGEFLADWMTLSAPSTE